MTKPWLGKVGALFHKKTKEAVSVTFDTTSLFFVLIAYSSFRSSVLISCHCFFIKPYPDTKVDDFGDQSRRLWFIVIA